MKSIYLSFFLIISLPKNKGTKVNYNDNYLRNVPQSPELDAFVNGAIHQLTEKAKTYPIHFGVILFTHFYRQFADNTDMEVKHLSTNFGLLVFLQDLNFLPPRYWAFKNRPRAILEADWLAYRKHLSKIPLSTGSLITDYEVALPPEVVPLLEDIYFKMGGTRYTLTGRTATYSNLLKEFTKFQTKYLKGRSYDKYGQTVFTRHRQPINRGYKIKMIFALTVGAHFLQWMQKLESKSGNGQVNDKDALEQLPPQPENPEVVFTKVQNTQEITEILVKDGQIITTVLSTIEEKGDNGQPSNDNKKPPSPDLQPDPQPESGDKNNDNVPSEIPEEDDLPLNLDELPFNIEDDEDLILNFENFLTDNEDDEDDDGPMMSKDKDPFLGRPDSDHEEDGPKNKKPRVNNRQSGPKLRNLAENVGKKDLKKEKYNKVHHFIPSLFTLLTLGFIGVIISIFFLAFYIYVPNQKNQSNFSSEVITSTTTSNI